MIRAAAESDNVDIATAEQLADPRESLPEEVLGTLVRLIREVRFGSIEIVVHEGRVTQIERREKVRFNHSATPRRA
jgi:hypothetical protein